MRVYRDAKHLKDRVNFVNCGKLQTVQIYKFIFQRKVLRTFSFMHLRIDFFSLLSLPPPTLFLSLFLFLSLIIIIDTIYIYIFCLIILVLHGNIRYRGNAQADSNESEILLSRRMEYFRLHYRRSLAPGIRIRRCARSFRVAIVQIGKIILSYIYIYILFLLSIQNIILNNNLSVSS